MKNRRMIVMACGAALLIAAAVVVALRERMRAVPDVPVAETPAAGVTSGTAGLKENLVELGSGIDALKSGLGKLDDALEHKDEASVLAAMLSLRTTVDALEKRVSDKRWPLPKYRDMLFLY